MLCPHCASENNRVLETRMQKEGSIRRRRACNDCQERFTTLETVIRQMPYVAKKDGRREPFDIEKLRKSLRLACMKRPVSVKQIDDIVEKITRQVLSNNDKEIGTMTVGQAVMRALRELDDVAYVRFASVYRNFKDVNEFLKVLEQDKDVTL
ncbi:MAG: transcriptional repressor NrdR [Pseudobdellovibrionaceae bacterium]|nr:transcriptional repressor NrdR [Bdellovibrionales bacterium]USN48831.1 MAG: transcriptional repressor NrdR [Pseudobdellovibrionaceae bacterium]